MILTLFVYIAGKPSEEIQYLSRFLSILHYQRKEYKENIYEIIIWRNLAEFELSPWLVLQQDLQINFLSIYS